MFKFDIPKTVLGILALITLILSSALQATILNDLNGKAHTLDVYVGQGKWLVVMLWISDCHVCNQEAHSYAQFHNKHKGDDATVLGISMDGAEGRTAASAFIERHQVTFPNLIGEFEEVAQMFFDLTGENWIGTPTFLFYSPAGELMAQQVGGVPVALIENFIKANS